MCQIRTQRQHACQLPRAYVLSLLLSAGALAGAASHRRSPSESREERVLGAARACGCAAAEMRRGTKQPDADPDAAAKVSDPLWVAIAEDKRREHLRQGRLLGDSWVSEEETLRPFASESGSEAKRDALGPTGAASARQQPQPKHDFGSSERGPVSSRASLMVAEQDSFGSSPRWSLLRSQSDLGVSRAYGSTLSSREPPPESEGTMQVPAGNGLIMWSDEDLRNFAAKRDLRFDGDRQALEAAVTGELRKDLEKNLKDAHKKPLGLNVTSPLPSFTFATDAHLTAAMGQAREPRHLHTDTKSVLQMLRQAISHRRTIYGTQLSDLREVFASMDTNNSGTLTADEVKAGFQSIELELTDDACSILFELLDIDHSGALSYAELLRAIKTDSVHSGGQNGSAAEPTRMSLKAIEIGKFRSAKGPGGICSAVLTFGSPSAPGGKLGGASLTWVMSRNDAYRNRGRIVLPLSDVIGLDVNGATLTVEVGRPPQISLGHAFYAVDGHASSTDTSLGTVQWESSVSMEAADKLTRGEAHRSRFHILHAASAFELNEWKQVLIQASHDHEVMLNAGLAFASGGGLRRSSVQASDTASGYVSAHRTDDGRFNSIHRKEFNLLQGSADATLAHRTDGRSIVRKRPASASPTVGRHGNDSGSNSNMARGGAMPGRYQSGSFDDSGSTLVRSLTGSGSRDRRGRLRHRSARTSQSLGNSAWATAHGSDGRSRAFTRQAEESNSGSEVLSQQWAPATGSSLLGHRPQAGEDDGYGYSGALSAHHSADAVGGVAVVRPPASRITPMAEERVRGRSARRSRDGSGAASLTSASATRSLTTRSNRSPSLYAETQLISEALLRRLRVNPAMVAAC